MSKPNPSTKRTPKDEVRQKVQHARCVKVEGPLYAIVRGASSYSIGYGKSREGAWADAARKLK